jgi:hypothetical protein
MPAAERGRRGHHRLFGLMAFHACRRLGRQLVPPVAVCARSAEAGSSVLDIDLLVTLVALKNRLFRWLVRVMASLAGHGVVHGEPHAPFGLERSMATRAVPASKHVGLQAENVARVAIHGHASEVDVGQRRLLLVALSADARVRGGKGLLRGIVTFVALDVLVDDVLRVSRGKANLGPVVWHGARGRGLPRLLDLLNTSGEPREEDARHESGGRHHADPKQSASHGPPR